MKTIFFFIAVLSFSTSTFAGSMKVEGLCSGKLLDGTPVAFQYYSDFDGCKKVSGAALSYVEGREGMLTGERSFTTSNDIYNFGELKLILKNSTGNTGARFQYTDDQGGKRTVELQCDVRDYEYSEC
ncbi:MAG: hypothetical protein ACJ76H_01345 [Bacteriovoracaceae bacterium]